MYRSEEVSLGRAAELAGLSIFAFGENLKAKIIKTIVHALSKEI